MKTKKAPSVLIVEGNQHILDMYALKFRNESLDVTVSTAGQDCVDVVTKGYAPDVLILDADHADVDIIEMLDYFRENNLLVRTQIILLTNDHVRYQEIRKSNPRISKIFIKSAQTPRSLYEATMKLINTKNIHAK